VLVVALLGAGDDYLNDLSALRGETRAGRVESLQGCCHFGVAPVWRCLRNSGIFAGVVTLEMWCPARGCGFESRALRFSKLLSPKRFCAQAQTTFLVQANCFHLNRCNSVQ
jgi:hypothetical protein